MPELAYSRVVLRLLSTLPENLEPEWLDRDDVCLTVMKHKERKSCYDRKHSVFPLPELHTGNTVKIKTDKDKLWLTHGTTWQADLKSRSYIAETPKGFYRMNHRHLQYTGHDANTNFASKSFVPAAYADFDPPITTTGPLHGHVLEVPKSLVAVDSPTPPVVTTQSRRVIPGPKKLDDFIWIDGHFIHYSFDTFQNVWHIWCLFYFSIFQDNWIELILTVSE